MLEKVEKYLYYEETKRADNAPEVQDDKPSDKSRGTQGGLE